MLSPFYFPWVRADSPASGYTGPETFSATVNMRPISACSSDL